MERAIKTGVGVVLVLLIGMTFASFPAHATNETISRGSFDAGVPSGGWTGFSDFGRTCEYNRSVASDGSKQYQRIHPANTDSCTSNPTFGAPSKGDVSISKSFPANPDEVYRAFAKGWIEDPVNAVAQVKLHFWDVAPDPDEHLGECYGINDTATSKTFDTSGEPPRGSATLTSAGGCKAPARTDEVVVSYRIHAKDAGASGRAVLDYITFGRCNSGTDCGNVPRP